MLLAIWMLVVVAAVVLYIYRAQSKFRRAGVREVDVTPFLGYMGPILRGKRHITEVHGDACKLYPRDRVIGLYELINPLLLVADYELLKKITIKDFDHFTDRRNFIDSETDPMFGRNLVSLKNEEWKDMRSSLSPAFTSSKIKLMVPFMNEVADQMLALLRQRIRDSKTGYIDVDAKDLATRFANDVIATCAFGINVSSQSSDSDFYIMSKKLTNPALLRKLIVVGYTSFPKLMKAMNAHMFSKEVREFFSNVVLGTMRHREEKGIIRNDMIHLLMEAKKGKLTHDTKTSEKDPDAGFATVEESAFGKKEVKKEWTDMDLVAQAALFLFAGFDTVSTAMSFMMHELALNPDVQERLVREIKDSHAKNKSFDYNTISKLPYLDMVLSEVLRKWPGVPLSNRECMKDYNMGRPNEVATKDYIIRKGQALQIPVFIYHRNPKFFPNPEKFDPERFSEENKHKIIPGTYLPFGQGPRNCIGSRFALCEIKTMMYHLLLNIELSVSNKTCVSGKLATEEPMITRLAGGHWVRMSLRQ